MSQSGNLKVLIAFAALTLAAPIVAVAAASTEALGGADAPKMRAALYYLGTTKVFARSKGVASVSTPDKGVLCVKLSKKSDIKDARKTVPVASTSSQGMADRRALTLVATGGTICPTGRRWLTVTTLRYDLLGFYATADNVSFSLVVP